MHRDQRALRAMLAAEGLTVIETKRTGKHWRVVVERDDGERTTLIHGGTPSCPRSLKNFRAFVRRWVRAADSAAR